MPDPVLEVMLLDNNEPTSYGEAMVGPYSDKWLEAMKSEINGSLRRRRTWTVMLPSMKLDLWQRDFSQVQGVDYDEIFSLVAMLKSVRIMLAIATIYEIWQKDVKTAFLKEFIKEELYMMQPEGFVNPKGANKVCKAPVIHLWTGASISELEYTL